MSVCRCLVLLLLSKSLSIPHSTLHTPPHSPTQFISIFLFHNHQGSIYNQKSITEERSFIHIESLKCAAVSEKLNQFLTIILQITTNCQVVSRNWKAKAQGSKDMKRTSKCFKDIKCKIHRIQRVGD